MMNMTFIGQLIAVFLMTAVYTFLHKENPIYRVAEHLVVGCAAGYYIVTNVNFIMKTGYANIVGGKPHYIIPIILGILLFTNLIPKYDWISRYGLAFTMGIGVSLAVRTAIITQILKQIMGAIPNIQSLTTPMAVINAIIVLAFTIGGIYYFTYTDKIRTKKLDALGTIGRFGLMVAFGASYGQTVGYRLNLIIGRMDAILEPSIRYYSFGIIILVIGALYYFERKKE